MMPTVESFLLASLTKIGRWPRLMLLNQKKLNEIFGGTLSRGSGFIRMLLVR